MNKSAADWCVLLVDDDEDDYLITRAMLREAEGRKISLEWAPGYEAGQLMLHSKEYQAVLIDYDLGISSGIQFIRETAQRGYPAPLILYTGRGSHQIDLEAMESGATLYLIKAEVSPLLLERSLRYAVERKRIEEALRESEAKFSVIFEKSAFPAALSKLPEGILVDVNEAWVALFGYTREEALGKTTLELGINPDTATRSRFITQLKEQGMARDLEMQLRKRSGELVILSVNIDMVDIRGEKYILNTTNDITARKRAEEELHQRSEALRLANDLLQAQAEELETKSEELRTQTGELMRANQKALEREKELRLIIDATPALISYVDASYRYRWVNRNYEVWFQQTTENVQGKFIWDIMGEGAWQAIRPYADQALSGTMVSYETELPRPGAGARWLHVTYTPDRDELGQVQGFVAHIFDMTENKRAEEARQESQARLEAALASMTDSVFIADMEGRVVEFNDAFVTYHRFQSREECSRIYDDYPKILEILLPDGSPAPIDMRAVPRALRGEVVRNAEYKVRRKDTGESWVGSYSFGPIRDSAGGVIGAVVVGRDITERKQAEEELRKNAEALRESEEKFHSAFANAAIGFAMSTPDGRIVDANAAYCALTGYDITELRGMEFQQMIHPDDHAENMRLIARMIAGFIPDFIVENRYIRKGGGSVWVCKSTSLVRGREGEPRWLIALVEDITERKRAEEEVRRNSEALLNYTRRLQRSNQALEDFTFVASHDLQEPLRKVQSFGDLLKTNYGRVLDERGQDYIERMRQAAERMQAMLDGLLAYAHLSSEGQPFTRVDLGQIVAEVLSDLEVRLEQTGGQVETGPLPQIEADPLQIRQLFQNLVGNALKFHRPGVPPRVKISSSPVDANLVAVDISDNGIGFENQKAGLLFRPFYRMKGRSEYEGSGMGLAICQKIVERHSGSISVDSRPGEGTTFRVILPIHPAR